MIDIEGFQSYLYEEELAPNTIAAYVRGVTRFSEMFDEITKQNLIAFKQHLIENFKPQTVNNRITAVLRYCDFKEIPMKLKPVKMPKKTYVDNVISCQQFETLIAGLEKDGNIHWYVNVMLLAKTGMRISEAIRICKKDVMNRQVGIYTKAHMRTVYFPKSLLDDIADYLETIQENETVMQGENGKSITSRGVSGALQRFARKYGIPKEVMHPHAFRHFFAIEFLKRNNNIALLADLLGHSSVNMTQIYLRQSKEQQREMIDKAVDW